MQEESWFEEDGKKVKLQRIAAAVPVVAVALMAQRFASFVRSSPLQDQPQDGRCEQELHQERNEVELQKQRV